MVAARDIVGLTCNDCCPSFLNHLRYRYGQLVEINSHSLFSKWFSEVSIYTNPVLWIVHHAAENLSSGLGKLFSSKSFRREIGEIGM